MKKLKILLKYSNQIFKFLICLSSSILFALSLSSLLFEQYDPMFGEYDVFNFWDTIFLGVMSMLVMFYTRLIHGEISALHISIIVVVYFFMFVKYVQKRNNIYYTSLSLISYINLLFFSFYKGCSSYAGDDVVVKMLDGYYYFVLSFTLLLMLILSDPMAFKKKDFIKKYRFNK